MRLGGTSVRARLTLWHAAALGIIVLTFSASVYFSVRSALLAQLDQQLAHDLDIVRQAAAGGAYELYETEEHGSISLFQVTGQTGVVYKTQAWAKAAVQNLNLSTREDGAWSSTTPTGDSYRIHAATLRTENDTLRVIVAEDERTVHQSLRSLALTLLLGFPGALALALVGGYLLSGKALSPIKGIVSKAQEITADRLSERLPVRNPDDEFGKLAIVFNKTFSRLQDSFDRLKRFTADASHELRTPLTAIRSIGEVALQSSTDPAFREVIGSMLEETDRLRALADSLLMLARADSGMAPLKNEFIDVGLLVQEAAEYMHALFEEKKQSLTTDLEEDIYVEADRTTLRQAIINLLDNATKYTPVDGHISATVRAQRPDAVIIEISDTGPGIPEDHRDRIFDRFYRVDPGRSSETGGAGLGLSIAQWAVEVNGGRLEFDAVEGTGSKFRIEMPVTESKK
jgi:heavy metal sensor kinase